MVNKYKKSLKSGLFSCAAAIILLTGCLPESRSGLDGSVDRQLATIELNAAAGLQYASIAQAALLQNSSFQSGALSPGLLTASFLGIEQDSMAAGLVQAAYCVEGAGPGANHMFMAWMEPEMKGIGHDTGPMIAGYLSQQTHPSSIGIYASNMVTLNGEREDGSTNINIGEGGANCGDLQIADGSAVMVQENLVAPTVENQVVQYYEFRSQDCPEGQQGSIEQRMLVEFDQASGDDNNLQQEWETISSSCTVVTAGDFNSLEATADTEKSIVSGLALGSTNAVTSALQSLENVECQESVTNLQEGEEQSEDIVSYTTCEGGEEIALNNADLSMVDSYVSYKTYQTGCGAGDLTPVSGSYNGWSGEVSFGAGWSGTAIYERGAHSMEEAESIGLERYGVWRGVSLSCTRTDTLNIECSTAFPSYGGSTFTPIDTGGITLTKTNRIDEWANRFTMEAEAPAGYTSGWSGNSASCSWDETIDFVNCPSNNSNGTWVSTQTGNVSRTVTGAIDTSTASQTGNGGISTSVSSWTSNTASICEKVSSVERPCNENVYLPGTYTAIVTRRSTATTPDIVHSNTSGTKEIIDTNNDDRAVSCTPIPPPPSNEGCNGGCEPGGNDGGASGTSGGDTASAPSAGAPGAYGRGDATSSTADNQGVGHTSGGSSGGSSGGTDGGTGGGTSGGDFGGLDGGTDGI